MSAFLTAANICGMSSADIYAQERYVTNNMRLESLDRGISAFNTGSGMLVSWRFLGSDSDNAEFKLYRDNNLIYTSSADKATCYLDKNGTANSVYRVDTIDRGNTSSDTCTIKSDKDYFDISMDIPTSEDCTYSPNDCSVGDVDGDGTYELFVKWDPSNSQDNANKGYTDNVYIDCYRLTGEKLWRVDLGKNIRAGQHYTQFLVADFDGDGKAEMTCKTADGTIDGIGKIIGNADADHRNNEGRIYKGAEYYTLFDGLTGKALDTVNYKFPRNNNSGNEGWSTTWGKDNYGNRGDRFLGAVCYLDGIKPSAVSIRGYYQRTTAVAYNVVNDKLVEVWSFDSGDNENTAGYGDGNHNCMPADVDNDGKQELVLGGCCIDDNGTILWDTNNGHGDAMHLGDFDPDRNGLELFVCHEEEPHGISLIAAETGKTIWRKNGDKDTGRAIADNIYNGNRGAEFSGSRPANAVLDVNGTVIDNMPAPANNFLIYWDGDLEREILDGVDISKMTSATKISTIFSAEGCSANNDTKNVPCLSADIFGDWREELFVRTADNRAIRVFSTPYETDVRLTTLMHDTQYRNQVAGQNIGYNQPPHLSIYLESDIQDIPENESAIKNGGIYRIQNKATGQYLTVDGNIGANSKNVLLGTGTKWKLEETSDGYYNLIAQGLKSNDTNVYALDVSGKKTADGTNIEIYTKKDNGENQIFTLLQNPDGSYKILTKITKDKSCVAIVDNDAKQYALVNENAENSDWIFIADTVDITVRKTWETVNSTAIPKPITIVLNQVNKNTLAVITKSFRTGTIESYTGNVGTLVFTDLPKTNNDCTVEYVYTIEELMNDEIGNQYVSSIVKSEDKDTIEITNKLKKGFISIKKEWINPDNVDLSNASVSVNILLNGKVYKTVTLSSPDWTTAEVVELPIYDGNGNPCMYSFNETVSGLDASYTQKLCQWQDETGNRSNVANGITISETEKTVIITNEVENDNIFLPDTGGLGTEIFTIIGFSLMMISFFFIAIKKKRCYEKTL